MRGEGERGDRGCEGRDKRGKGSERGKGERKCEEREKEKGRKTWNNVGRKIFVYEEEEVEGKKNQGEDDEAE